MHLHVHGHDHEGHGHGGARALSIALVITIVFIFVQLIGGWFANSIALMADAAHMTVDAGSILLSLFALWITQRPVSGKMSYGYYRAEILGALISGLVLWMVSLFLIYEAIMRLFSPPAVRGETMFFIALATLCMNLLTMRILHGSQKDNLNIRAAYYHVLSDLLGSIGTLLAGLIIWLTGWRLADPILTLLFTALIFYSSWKLISEAVEILMEASPRKIDPEEVKKTLLSIPSVEEVHDLHIWTIGSGRLAMSVHLISREGDRVLPIAHQFLLDKHKIQHMTIQIEHPGSFQSKFCYD